MDDSDSFGAALTFPTPSRPLLGLTVLAVEDSRFACEALRLMCLRSGARVRRADCLRSARRHLQVYRPSVIIVDLGLPDGSGLDLIGELVADRSRVPVILATSGDRFAEHAAQAAGADGFLAKPLDSLALFQRAVLAHLPEDRRPVGPRLASDEPIRPDPVAYLDDMAHAADVLNDIDDPNALDYVAQFVGGVARSAADDALARAAEDLAQARRDGRPVAFYAAQVAGLVQTRLYDRAVV